MQRWEADATYRFDRTASREQVFAIDTPPPTVSGSLHIGHVFSYTHTDTIARYQRMPGKAVFYPCLLYTSPSPRDRTRTRIPSSA